MKRFHLNMWQRIGVVASVIWIVVAGVKRRMEIMDTALLTASMDRDACLQQQRQACEGVWTKTFELYANDRWPEVVATAVVPVVLAWIVAYAVLFTFRWVLAGRQPT